MRIASLYRYPVKGLSPERLTRALEVRGARAEKGLEQLGLATGGMLVAESEAEMTLVFDLALYTAKQHRSRALAAPPEAPVEVGSPGDVPEARRLLDEVLREHERIRVRFSGMALYEERLRKLEAARWPGAATGSDGAGTA